MGRRHNNAKVCDDEGLIGLYDTLRMSDAVHRSSHAQQYLSWLCTQLTLTQTQTNPNPNFNPS